MPGWDGGDVVCVLGVHRGGTSAVARVLNLLGLYLGAEGDLIPPQADNPTGFWEHAGLVDVNERVLARIGSRNGHRWPVWRDASTLDTGWESSTALRPIAWRAEAIIRLHFGGHDLWGWKDPRTCLTLPFWQRLVPNLRYVICVRNPNDVAMSLAERNGATPDEGYELWGRYMNAAIAGTVGQPRLIVRYESLLDRPQGEVQRLAQFLGRVERAREPAVRAAIAAYLDEGLWHHRSTAGDSPTVSVAVRDLYRILVRDAHRCEGSPSGTHREAKVNQSPKRWEERADPGKRGLTHTEDEHRARYLWASQRLSGRVLDVACGTGYGSQILAHACDVNGADRDGDAVATARARVPHGSFQIAEVPPIPYEDAEFDHAVCFETIEHVDTDAEVIAELRRVVAPNGHLLISTPNRAMTSPNDARPQNPYHAREYLLPEFVELLQRGGFDRIDVYFQRKERRRAPEYLAGAIIARIPWLCQPGRWWDRLAHGSSDVEPWSPEVTHPMFWVLDCS